MVQIWSRYPPKFGGDETLVVHRVAGPHTLNPTPFAAGANQIVPVGEAGRNGAGGKGELWGAGAVVGHGGRREAEDRGLLAPATPPSEPQ